MISEKSKIIDRILKSKKDINAKMKDFFAWIKGAEIIDLESCNTDEDPVRPELDNEFRTSYGRKIYGVKYKEEIHAVMCFAFTNKIPKTVKESSVSSISIPFCLKPSDTAFILSLSFTLNSLIPFITVFPSAVEARIARIGYSSIIDGALSGGTLTPLRGPKRTDKSATGSPP